MAVNKIMNYIEKLKPIFNQIINKRNIVIPLLLFLFIFSVYMYTAPHEPTGYADSEELMTASYTLGIAHAPGYLMFIILGKLFTLIPIGTIAFRFSIFSTLFSALTVLLIYLVIFRLTKKISVSLIGALSLAFSYIFWLWSLIPENFFLLAFFTASLIYIMVCWYQDRDDDKKRKKYPYLFIFIFVLSTWAQQLILFLVPAFIYLIWKIDKELFKPCKRWWGMIGSAILGFLPVFYFPLAVAKQPFLDYGNPHSFIKVIELITRHVYRIASSEKAAYLPTGGWQLPERFYQLFHYLVFLVDQFTPIVIAIAIIGIIFVIKKKSTRVIGIFILLCFLFSGPVLGLYAPLSVVYPHETFLTPFLDKYASTFDVSLNEHSFNSLGALERFYTMSFTVFSIFIGLGVFFILRLLRKAKFGSKLILIVVLLFFAIPIFPFRDNFGVVNKRNFTLGRDFMENTFNVIEPNAIFILRGDRPTFSAYYYQNVLKKRPDITLIGFGWRPWNVERLDQREPDLFNTKNLHLLAVLRDVIRTNIDKRPIYINGLPNAELVQLGIGGDPFIVSPRGVLLKIDKEWNLGTNDYWENMVWNGPKNINNYYDQYAKELVEQYIIGHSNGYYHNRVRGYHDLAYKDMLAMRELAPDYYLTKTVTEDWEKNQTTQRAIKELVLGEAKIHYDMGGAYWDKKKVTEAMSEFSAAVYIEPDNVKYRSVLGGVYEVMLWYEEALEQYNEILRLAPEDLELKEQIESRIEKISDKIEKGKEYFLLSEIGKIQQILLRSFNKNIDRFNLKKPWQLLK